ncbi:MAG: hypothetical protein M1828_007655 [Chrysothrix sp. TS-e1954]|nr:MAG: hypothetical protein M1828_007655 [Chrysothrix sp. TS-e1954]
MSTSFKRIPLVKNSHYQRDGLKSYGHALVKFNIGPTFSGPFFSGIKAEHQGKFAGMIGGKTRMKQHVLMKRHEPSHAPSSGTGSEAPSGQVSASDIQNDSEYLCPVAIGTPAQTLMLDFDTGSSDLWLWSSEIPSHQLSQYKKGHTVFDSSKSSTFKNMSGSSWQIQYGDSSTASGTVGTDKVDVGGLVIKDQAIELAKTISTQFLQGAGDGLLGLAWSNINTVQPKPVQTPVDNMITQDDIPKSQELFTAYLGSWRDANEPDKGQSFYTFGFIDQDVLTQAKATASDIHYTPVDNSQGFWQFPSTKASINGTSIALSNNTAIADTGTTLALVSDQVVEAVYKAIPGAKYDSTQQGYVFPTKTTADKLPIVQVDIGGKLFTIQKEDLAFADAGNGMTYGGIQSRGDMDLDILGDVFLKGVYAIFDHGNKRFGALQRVEQVQNLAPAPSS